MSKPLNTPATKRYLLQGMMLLAAIGLGVWGVALSTSKDSLAQGDAVEEDPPREIKPSAYSHIQKIRKAAALTKGDLAALDLSQESTEAVLTRLADWTEANEQRLAQAERSVFAAQRELNKLQRLVRTGKATANDKTAINTKSQAVETAKAALLTLRGEGAASAMQAASAKAADWQKARAVAASMPVRMRHLTTMTPARLDQLKAEAARRGVDLEEALSANEKQQLDTIRQRIHSKLPGVRAAEEAALPVPEALRGDEGQQAVSD